MTVLRAHGVALDLPNGWEGRIRRRDARRAATGPVAFGPPTDGTAAVAHAATFALPAEVGDFGGGAVEHMRHRDLFVALVEYDRDSVGTALFRRSGIPRRLRPDVFDPQALQRTLPGQAGTQVFFTDHGRAFCLYVVLGSHLRRGGAVPAVNQVLAGLHIEGPAASG